MTEKIIYDEDNTLAVAAVSLNNLRAPAYSHRGLAALAPEAVAAGHQVVAVWRNVAVGLDVLLGWESVGHLPRPAVPHPATTSV